MTKYLQKTFNLKRVSDGREIGNIFFDKEESCFVGYVLPTFGGVSVSVKWDMNGKSNLTANSNLLRK